MCLLQIIGKIFIYVFIFILIKCKIVIYPPYSLTSTSSTPSFYKKSVKYKLGYIPEKIRIKSINTGFMKVGKKIVDLLGKVESQIKIIDKLESQYQSILNFKQGLKEIKKRTKVEKNVLNNENRIKDKNFNDYHHRYNDSIDNPDFRG